MEIDILFQWSIWNIRNFLLYIHSDHEGLDSGV
ncbi:uncharacterized protein METZ01_LOCUS263797, partial [marine metagenome]